MLIVGLLRVILMMESLAGISIEGTEIPIKCLRTGRRLLKGIWCLMGFCAIRIGLWFDRHSALGAGSRVSRRCIIGRMLIFGGGLRRIKKMWEVRWGNMRRRLLRLTPKLEWMACLKF
jgi:hypothetical protein